MIYIKLFVPDCAYVKFITSALTCESIHIKKHKIAILESSQVIASEQRYSQLSHGLKGFIEVKRANSLIQTQNTREVIQPNTMSKLSTVDLIN